MFWIPSQLEGAYVGQDITLECHSEAFPKSINYWIKEDGAMLISGMPLDSIWKKKWTEIISFEVIW